MPRGLLRGLLVARAAPLGMCVLIAVPGWRCDDGGELLNSVSRPPITLRKQSAEFVDRVHRIEIHGKRVGAYPRARIQTFRPLGQIVGFERRDDLRLNAKRISDQVDGYAGAHALATKACDERLLRGHVISNSAWKGRAIPGPLMPRSLCSWFCLTQHDLATVLYDSGFRKVLK